MLDESCMAISKFVSVFIYLNESLDCIYKRDYVCSSDFHLEKQIVQCLLRRLFKNNVDFEQNRNRDLRHESVNSFMTEAVII